MATPTPNDFAYFRRAEPFQTLTGTASTFGFDYFRRGEPLFSLSDVAAASGGTFVMNANLLHPQRQMDSPADAIMRGGGRRR